MRILIVSDAWHPQINGVVRTLDATRHELEKAGHDLRIIGPEAPKWRSLSAPSYPSIKLELFGHWRLRRVLKEFQPDFIHIATEGPLGWAMRSLCLHHRQPFTTSYHTRFPEYLAARVPKFLSRAVLMLAYMGVRRFHTPSSAIMVATLSIEKELHQHKLRRIVRWSRGVDTVQFQSYGKNLPAYADLPRPILLYVGRVAVEKNLRAFLDLRTPGSKVIIGDGPDMHLLKNEYPAAHFLGTMEGEQLGRHYAAADLFVFPSTTDTFGLVLLEACAAGLRIASYPAPGPADIFSTAAARAFAVLDSNLEQAVAKALDLPDTPALPRHFAENFSWQTCSQQFFSHLQAPTPLAIRRLNRLRNGLNRWRQQMLALYSK